MRNAILSAQSRASRWHSSCSPVSANQMWCCLIASTSAAACSSSRSKKNRNRHPVRLELPVLPVLQQIIDASPCGDLTFLVTEFGKPFTAKGFSSKMRQWCDRAGLPHCTAHSLRKAGAVSAAHNGATPHQLMAIFGWRTLKEAERYTKDAEQRRIASGAMGLLIAERSGNESG